MKYKSIESYLKSQTASELGTIYFLAEEMINYDNIKTGSNQWWKLLAYMYGVVFEEIIRQERIVSIAKSIINGN